MSAVRLVLKQPTGWFAAGREVAAALSLLSDGAFKLYVHLCLQANRHTGRAVIELPQLTELLQKDALSVEAGLAELQRHEVCERHGDQVEICDRFWPYQKQIAVVTSNPQVEFVRQVREAFLKPACVRSAFTAADEKLTLNLFQGGVGMQQLRRAIWLGCARTYMAMLNGQTRLPITSLAYFASLIDEVSQPQIPQSYWEHVRHRVEEMERRWLQTRRSAAATNSFSAGPPSPEMI
jgi:hypothetical protein